MQHLDHPQGRLQVARVSMWLFAATFSIMVWLGALAILRAAL